MPCSNAYKAMLERMAELNLRPCRTCKRTKHLHDFYRQSNGWQGRQAHCIPCSLEADRIRNANDGGRAARRIAARRAANPEREAQIRRAWVDKNRERRRKSTMASQRRMQMTPHGRMKRRMASQLYHMLRGAKARRKTVDLIGYTTEELCAHIERQFHDGMSWENIGDWHIDHIVPLASFNITGPDDPELKRAWALANLRPLWASANKRKHAKREFLI